VTPTTTSSAEARSYQWYADGQWRDAPSSFDDFEPYTGSVYAHAPNCGAEEAKIAIAAAHVAFPIWAETAPAEKARLFLKAAEIVRWRRAEIAGILAPAITRSNHESACACHQPSHTPQLDSKFKIPAGKDNLPRWLGSEH
jgi:delta 1-pyrroline-5-carboxylate dehydrogenase